MSVTPHPGEMIINHPDSIRQGELSEPHGSGMLNVFHTQTNGFYLFTQKISDMFLSPDSEVEDPGFISGGASCSIIQQPGFFLAEGPREAPAVIV